MNFRISVFTLLTTLLLFGCDSQVGPGDDTTQSLELSLSISPDVSNAAAKAGSGFAGLVLFDGTNTLDISSVGIVLRKIELEKVDGFDCDEFDDDAEEGGENENESSESLDHSDDCEEFETGPVLLEPSLDGSVEHVTSIQIPEGMYNELEFDIHKINGDSQEGIDFLQLHPEYDGVSIRVMGTYNDVSFVFEQDLDEEQEIEFNAPLEIRPDSAPTNITLHMDIATWFATVPGMFVDPAEANYGGLHESLVEENIKRSIDVFEDDDHDGHDDDDDNDGDESDDD